MSSAVIQTIFGGFFSNGPEHAAKNKTAKNNRQILSNFIQQSLAVANVDQSYLLPFIKKNNTLSKRTCSHTRSKLPFSLQKNFSANSCFLTSVNCYFCDSLEKPGE
jgi:hypothetical protein